MVGFTGGKVCSQISLPTIVPLVYHPIHVFPQSWEIHSLSFPIFRVGRAFKRVNLELHSPLRFSLSLSSLTTLSCSFSLYLSFSLSPSLWFSINNFSIFLHSLISLSTCAVFLSPTLFRLIHWRHGYRPEIPRLGLCVYTCIHVEYSHVYVSSDTLYHLMHLVAYELMIRVNHTHIFVMLLGSTSSMPWDDIKPVCH